MPEQENNPVPPTGSDPSEARPPVSESAAAPRRKKKIVKKIIRKKKVVRKKKPEVDAPASAGDAPSAPAKKKKKIVKKVIRKKKKVIRKKIIRKKEKAGTEMTASAPAPVIKPSPIPSSPVPPQPEDPSETPPPLLPRSAAKVKRPDWKPGQSETVFVPKPKPRSGTRKKKKDPSWDNFQVFAQARRRQRLEGLTALFDESGELVADESQPGGDEAKPTSGPAAIVEPDQKSITQDSTIEPDMMQAGVDDAEVAFMPKVADVRVRRKKKEPAPASPAEPSIDDSADAETLSAAELAARRVREDGISVIIRSDAQQADWEPLEIVALWLMTMTILIGVYLVFIRPGG